MWAALCLGIPWTARAQDGAWPTYHGDYSLRGVAEATIGASPKLVWRVRVGQEVSSPVVAGGGRLFVLHDANVLTALGRAGKKLWSYKLPFAVEAPIAYADGKVLVGGRQGRLFAFAAGTGSVAWQADTGDRIAGTPAVAAAGQGGKRAVHIITQPEGVVQAFDLGSGARLWKSQATVRSDGHMAVAGGQLVFGNCDAGLQIMRVAGGQKGPFVEVGEDAQMAGGIAVLKGRAYAGNRSGAVVCLDIENARIAWTYDQSEGEMFTTPAVTEERVVFCSGKCVIHCLDTQTGSVVWTHATKGSEAHSPVIAGNKVVAAVDGTLILLRLADGKLLWSNAVADSLAGPSVAYGQIVVGTDDGQVITFGEEGSADGNRSDPGHTQRNTDVPGPGKQAR